MWQEFFVAVALVLVIEGLLPFISPKMAQDVYRKIALLDPAAVRKSGLMSMALGLILLYWLRG